LKVKEVLCRTKGPRAETKLPGTATREMGVIGEARAMRRLSDGDVLEEDKAARFEQPECTQVLAHGASKTPPENPRQRYRMDGRFQCAPVQADGRPKLLAHVVFDTSKPGRRRRFYRGGQPHQRFQQFECLHLEIRTGMVPFLECNAQECKDL